MIKKGNSFISSEKIMPIRLIVELIKEILYKMNFYPEPDSYDRKK